VGVRSVSKAHWTAQESFKPHTDVAQIDGNDDVTLDFDHVTNGRTRVSSQSNQIVGNQALF
jgi:hypothetical protein